MTRLGLSLRALLLLGVAMIACVLLAVTWTVSRTTEAHLIDQVDRQLMATDDLGPRRRAALDLALPPPAPADAIDSGLVPEWVADGATDQGQIERLSPLFEAGVRADGSVVVFFEPNLPGQSYSAPDLSSVVDGTAVIGEPFTVDGVDGDVRYRMIVSQGNELQLVRALGLTGAEDTVDRLVLLQGIGVGTVLMVLAGFAWAVTKLGIRPIHTITASAAEIAEGDLSVRVPEPSASATEAAAMARAFNTMVGRIETAVEGQAASEERLRQFVADASHELRTPLTTIQGYAELARSGGLSNPNDLARAMEQTELEAKRMGRMVADMLALARLDRERPLESTRLDLSRMVADVADNLQVASPEHVVSTSLQDGIEIHGDADRLRQAVSNVVANALAHTPPGTEVTVLAARGAGETVVEVTDDGPGIAAQHLGRLTERFYRTDSSRARTDNAGSGLGLAIADAVLSAHGGELRIASQVGAGTTVTLTIPQ